MGQLWPRVLVLLVTAIVNLVNGNGLPAPLFRTTATAGSRREGAP